MTLLLLLLTAPLLSISQSIDSLYQPLHKFNIIVTQQGYNVSKTDMSEFVNRIERHKLCIEAYNENITICNTNMLACKVKIDAADSAIGYLRRSLTINQTAYNIKDLQLQGANTKIDSQKLELSKVKTKTYQVSIITFLLGLATGLIKF